MTATTISDEYRLQQMELHQNPNYGIASLHFAPIVAEVIRKSGAKSVADYGAGKQNLLKGLTTAGVSGFDYRPYDPAFPDYGPARPADLVCCIDVLEHIEPEFVDNVIAELAALTPNLGFFSVHMGPAGKVLSDGRNAHLIQKPSSWWLKKLTDYFDVMDLRSHNLMGRGFWVLVRPIAPVAQPIQP